MSPSAYLDEFRSSDEKRASLLDRNMGDLRRDLAASNSIVTTWQITFEQIRQERRTAADLLVFMSFFNPQVIPGWVLRIYHRSSRGEDGTDVSNRSRGSDRSGTDEFEDDVEVLREYSLVTDTTQADVYEIHALVQLCTREWLSSFEDERRWRRKFLQVVAYPSGEYENWT